MILRYDFALGRAAKSSESSLLSSLWNIYLSQGKSVSHFALACSIGKSKVRVSSTKGPLEVREVTLLLMGTLKEWILDHLEARKRNFPNHWPPCWADDHSCFTIHSPCCVRLFSFHVIIFCCLSHILHILLTYKLRLDAVPCAFLVLAQHRHYDKWGRAKEEQLTFSLRLHSADARAHMWRQLIAVSKSTVA